MSYCTRCGTEDLKDQKFCRVCGAPRSLPPDVLTGPSTPSDTSGSDAAVRVGVALEPPRHSRPTIFFRLILVTPLYVVGVVVGVAAFSVTAVAWFCALFTGRVPDSQQRFLAGTLRLYGNVAAYAYLLIARWPGVVFNPKSDDQVSVEIDHVRLRRWSVFFRMVLAFPASLVWNALYLGSVPLLLVAWVWGIVAGREPRSIHQVLALVLRFQLRLLAYWSLLTPTQPFRGFLGDVADPIELENPPFLSSRSVNQPTRWFVTRGAKVLMVLTLMTGILFYFFAPSFESPFIVKIQDLVSRGVVTTSRTETLGVLRRFDASSALCRGSFVLECQQRAATLAYPRLNEQSTLLLSNNFFVPTNALTSVRAYEVALDALVFEFSTLRSSSSLRSQSHVIKIEIPKTVVLINRDFRIAEARLGACGRRSHC